MEVTTSTLNKNIANLQQLNDDVLLETMKYLGVMDIVALRQTSERLEALSDNHLSRKVKRFHIDPKFDRKSKEIIRNLGQHLEALHLVSVCNPHRVDKLRQQIQLIHRHCTKLTSLIIETRNWYVAKSLNASVISRLQFEHLKHLELHNIRMDKDFDLVPTFEHLETLKFDSITNFSGQSLVDLRKLKVLHLIDCAQLKPNHLYDFFKVQGESLREILIHKCRDIDEIILNEINSHLPNIEHISLAFSYAASFDPSSLHCLQNLKSLCLHNFKTYNVNRFINLLASKNTLEQWEINGENLKIYQLDGNAIDKLEKMHQLDELSFVKCNFVTDDLLLRLARNLNLKKFSVRDCWGFSVNGLMKFVQLSRKLTFLSIKNCTILRSATIDIANMVLEDEERPAIHIDYDIDCGYRPYVDDMYDDHYDSYNYSVNYGGYCDSDCSDSE